MTCPRCLCPFCQVQELLVMVLHDENWMFKHTHSEQTQLVRMMVKGIRGVIDVCLVNYAEKKGVVT